MTMEMIIWERIEALLHRVQKPGRYVGGEYNAVHKPWDTVQSRVCLAFPDVYDLGMSNFALAILYDILNAQPTVLAERTYLPAPDMIAQLQAAQIPLYTLESYRPVAAFDVLAISTAYEQLYTNALTLLDLAGLPIHSADRDARYPLVIGGGHATFNPEPITDFFDVFVIGEAEEVLLELLATWHSHRAESREAQLRALLPIEGLYVPRFYRPRYHTSGMLIALEPTEPAAPAIIRKRIMPTLPPTPVRQLVPNVATTHNRAVIEIHRGCTRGCRFCQAGSITRPIRERSAAEIRAVADAILAHTGYEEIALLSLSSADHSEIKAVLEQLVACFEGRHVSISLPSLRIESFSVDLADMLTQGRRSGFTFAPEAASDRLRARINKAIATEDLLAIAEEVFSRGWRTIKLYFMLGLPGETDADIEAMIDLARQVRGIGRRAGGRKTEVHVSVSTFVPKPHTTFQWEPLADAETVARRQARLFKRLRGRALRLSWNEYPLTCLEALLTRGDRRLNVVVERAWRLGARFDAWREWGNMAAWEQAFAEASMVGFADGAALLDFYLYRERAEDEVLPWDHLQCGVSKRFFKRDNARSQAGELLDDCRNGCHACGILQMYPNVGKREEGLGKKEEERRKREEAGSRKQEARILPPASCILPLASCIRHQITFATQKTLAYVSVLELGRVWERTLRRAAVPLKYSQGFSPRPRMQFAAPLPVGCGSEADLLDITLASPQTAAEIAAALVDKVPQDLMVLAVVPLPDKTPALSEQLVAADYRVWLRDVDRAVVEAALADFLQAESVPLAKRGRKYRGKMYDLRPLVTDLRLVDAPTPWVGVWLSVSARPGATGRPDEVLKALGLEDAPRRCTRARLILKEYREL